MTLSVIVDIADPTWMCALPDLDALAKDTVRRTIMRAAPPYANDVEIGVTLADDDFVQALNKQYRGKDKPTNVLSFPAANAANEDAPILLGDIVLALQTVIREADEAGKPLAAHTKHLIVHGVLHLLGHDHEVESDANIMESLEIEILDAMGIANPYITPVEID